MAIIATLLKAPIHLYRWTLKPYVGWQCRHLPTCSEYALEAVDKLEAIALQIGAPSGFRRRQSVQLASRRNDVAAYSTCAVSR